MKVILIIFVGVLCFLITLHWFLGTKVKVYPAPTFKNTPTVVVYPTVCYQSYWYCWNSGSPYPHHLRHYTYGDHICSCQELGK